MKQEDKSIHLEPDEIIDFDTGKPMILQDTTKLSMEQMLSLDKKRNKDNRFISRFFKDKDYKIVKVQSEKQNKYLFYKTHPYLNYKIITKTTKADLIDDILSLFSKEDPFWFQEDYETEGKGIIQLQLYIRDKIPRVNNFVNDPAKSLIFCEDPKDPDNKTFNYFQNTELLVNRPDVDYDFPTIKKVIMNLCENNTEYYNWTMSWFAFLYQNPCYRFNTSIMFIGAKGSGKGMLSRALKRIFEHCCYIGNSKDLSSNFNAQLLEGKLLLLANEILDQQKKYQFSNDLKEMITEPEISVEKKFQDRYNAKNYIKCIFFSNSSNPINIEEGDRRFSVFKSKKLNIPHEILRRYHEDTDGFFTKEVLGLCSYLNKLTTDQSIAINPIMTPAKQDIAIINLTDFKAMMLDIMEQQEKNWVNTTNGYYMEQKVLYICYVEEANPRDKLSRKKFGSRLRINDFEVIPDTTMNKVTGNWVKIPEEIVEKLK